MQHDFIKRQIKDFAKVLAYLLGLAKKGELAEVILEIDGILQRDLGLQPDFRAVELLELYEAGKLDYDGVKQLVALLKLRSEALQREDIKQAQLNAQKALEIAQKLEVKSGTFDLELHQWQLELKNLRTKL